MNEEAYDRKKFEEMEKCIEYKRRFGKVPLFIIGAGVSVGKVPLMNDIFGFFTGAKEIIRSTRNLPEPTTNDEKNEIEIIETYAKRLYENKKISDRSYECAPF